MEGLFTYADLATLSGAAMATLLVVEFLKNIGRLKGWSMRGLILTVALTLIIITNLATGNFSFRDIPLYLLNGLLVAVSATGSRQMFGSKIGTRT
ncbi:MAG: hypothetical protein IMW96_01010 [Thermoanaerobacteraceae bacterium]|uniref:hypothetical protein n=1 Tax=Thermanaeromonas sp. C210 TaxID=2731925 RepID=UPI00155B9F91|nr:hypothetical protein [Thermanaeromonas sp. C210]MBE3580211.1 hypothetical protein [Thermoanaerobacteraceae bacterium]GFN22954.1 hypothetical protein TAMC210_12710 [Thermanaeromonas sp. C210]